MLQRSRVGPSPVPSRIIVHPAGAVLVGLGCESLWSTLQVQRPCLLAASCFLTVVAMRECRACVWQLCARRLCIQRHNVIAAAAAAGTAAAATARTVDSPIWPSRVEGAAMALPPAVQNLLSLGLWSTLRSIFIALLVVVGVFDLVSVSIPAEETLQHLSLAAIICAADVGLPCQPCMLCGSHLVPVADQ